MNRITSLLLVLTTLLLFSCKKNNDRDQLFPFLATGYWVGELSAGTGLSVLNREDGTCRMYMLLTSSDTAMAPIKYEGTHRLVEGLYHAEFRNTENNSYNNIFLQASRANASFMSGTFLQDGSDDGTHYSSGYAFNMTKQQ